MAPPGSALLLSLVIRDPPALLPLRAGLAVADLAGPAARVKWPNDVLLDGRKVAGVLAEGRPQEGWAVVGIGVNAAVDLAELPGGAARERAGTLGLAPDELAGALATLLAALERRLGEPRDDVARRPARARRAAGRAGRAGPAARAPAPGSPRTARCGCGWPAGGEKLLDAGEVHLAPGL